MRLSHLLLLGGVLLGGCSDEEQAPGLRRGVDLPPRGGASDAVLTPAQSACAPVPGAVSLSDAKDARDVAISGGNVFYRVGEKVHRISKDAKDPKEVYTGPNLVRSFVDGTSMMLVESNGDNLEATLRVVPTGTDEAPAGPLDGKGVAAGTNFPAAGTRVFASDETSFYVLADTTGGDVIAKVEKANPGNRAILRTSLEVVSNPQLANGAIWYVADRNRVFKIPLAAPGAEVEGALEEGKEIFGLAYASCGLAVTDDAAFCSMGDGLERRDLTGANPKMVLDAKKSVAPVRFGDTVSNGGALVVRSAEPDPNVKHVIRLLKPKAGDLVDEKLVACGRSLVTDLAVDATHVVWAEQDGGVFIAPR
jgi:hypothetical protein